jgi:hypothetical protein
MTRGTTKGRGDMKLPPKMTGLDLAFGNIDHLPPWKAIPDEFKRMGDPWTDQVGRWFAVGADKEWESRITPKAGVNRSDAFGAVAAILRSWEPKHEHKEAGAAYLMSLWFDDPALAPPLSSPKEPRDAR